MSVSPSPRPATLTVQETAAVMGVSVRTVYRLIKAGAIPILPGGRKRIITAKLFATLGLDQATIVIPVKMRTAPDSRSLDLGSRTADAGTDDNPAPA